MALVLADRVRESSGTTGTGTITLAGAAAGYRSFAAIGNANTTFYTITNGAEWEVGIGTYTAAGTTLSRDTVLASSNAGSLVNFSAGTKDVFVTYPSGRSAYSSAGLTAGRVVKASGATELADSLLFENGTGIGIGANPSNRFQVFSAAGSTSIGFDFSVAANPVLNIKGDPSSGYAPALAFNAGGYENNIIAFYGDTRYSTYGASTGHTFYCQDAYVAKISKAGVYPMSDNTYPLGLSGNRWTTVYAVTGTINTSDETLKQWHGMPPSLKAKYERIGTRLLDELGLFQFLSAIEEKGADGARWHFGARAQRGWHIVADEGLAPPLIEVNGMLLPDFTWTGPVAPAWLCFDTWNDEWEDEVIEEVVTGVVGHEPTGELDEEGNEILREVLGPVRRQTPTGKRIKKRSAGCVFGFRTDQITMLVAWSLHERLKKIEGAMK